ncbi:hypothetical protein [Vibrio cholerae]|uniref:hypothetical protein n=1 Tax=Vibrio cholerae TaxID=666 RepID=UPI0010FE91FC|nr:hypothetical protein [Vibrio cholerae]TLE17675.1 hypothetical protein D2924_17855 [Vibrio cholerae]TLE28369.1 hypothetical protein D2925_17635 [Vibrio cholerae]
MTLVSDIKNLDGLFLMTAISMFIAIFSPGILTIYLFLPQLFFDLDSFKLLMFAVSLSLPVFALNAMMILVVENTVGEGDFQVPAYLGSVTASVVMFTSLLAAYLFGCTFSYFLISVAILELLLAMVLFVIVKHDSKKSGS